jgi:hypothetical protein
VGWLAGHGQRGPQFALILTDSLQATQLVNCPPPVTRLAVLAVRAFRSTTAHRGGELEVASEGSAGLTLNRKIAIERIPFPRRERKLPLIGTRWPNRVVETNGSVWYWMMKSRVQFETNADGVSVRSPRVGLKNPLDVCFFFYSCFSALRCCRYRSFSGEFGQRWPTEFAELGDAAKQWAAKRHGHACRPTARSCPAHVSGAFGGRLLTH